MTRYERKRWTTTATPSRGGLRLDLDVREAARREQVADGPGRHLVGERLADADFQQPRDLGRVDGSVRRVGDRGDGGARRAGDARLRHLLAQETGSGGGERPREKDRAPGAAPESAGESQLQYLARRRTSTKYTPFSSRPARSTTVLDICHSIWTIGGLDVSRDCEYVTKRFGAICLPSVERISES